MSTKTDVSRRTMIRGASVLPAVAILPTAALAATPADADAALIGLSDPIFAAIEHHRAAAAEWLRQVTIGDELSAIIPNDKTQNYHVQHRDDPEVGKDDDPRWTAARKEYWSTSDKLEDAAIALVSTEPSTVVGAAALLDYYAKTLAMTDGSVFPETLEDADDPNVKKYGAPYAYFIAHNAADALRRVAGQEVQS